ncbi:MAG: hypothetical protein ACTSQB_02340 [Candidatus Heimdallarchaeota archaeon]
MSGFFNWGKKEKVEKIIEEAEKKEKPKDDSISVVSSTLTDGSTPNRLSKSRRKSTKVNYVKRVFENDDA